MKSKSFKQHLVSCVNCFLNFQEYDCKYFFCTKSGKEMSLYVRFSNVPDLSTKVFEKYKDKIFLDGSVNLLGYSKILKNVVKYVFSRIGNRKLKIELEGSYHERLYVSNGIIDVLFLDVDSFNIFNLTDFKFDRYSSDFAELRGYADLSNFKKAKYVAYNIGEQYALDYVKQHAEDKIKTLEI